VVALCPVSQNIIIDRFLYIGRLLPKTILKGNIKSKMLDVF
jgi:hypothetical protein